MSLAREMGMEEIDDAVMTNFDHSINRKVEAQLRAKPNEVCSVYAGMNFCGYVWFDGAKLKCEVLVYHEPQKVFSAEDLETIMEEVSSEFGWE